MDFTDFIEYYSKDKETKVITLYMESLKQEEGKKFIEVCKKCKKPIIALKAGKSQKGQEAAKSHTAALASEQGVYSGIFRQAGIIETNNIEELFNAARILEKYSKIGNKALIITNAGGLGVLTADSCEENKIELPSLKQSTIEKLNKILPQAWSKHNPVDILGDALAKDYEKTIQSLEQEEKQNFDFFIILLTPQYMTEELATAKIIANIQSKSKINKPVFACFLGGNKIKGAEELMNKNNIIHFEDVREMCECLGKIVD